MARQQDVWSNTVKYWLIRGVHVKKWLSCMIWMTTCWTWVEWMQAMHEKVCSIIDSLSTSSYILTLVAAVTWHALDVILTLLFFVGRLLMLCQNHLQGFIQSNWLWQISWFCHMQKLLSARRPVPFLAFCKSKGHSLANRQKPSYML